MTKILIVEDNELNRDMLTRRLTRKGFQILTAVDGESALAVAAAEQPAVVLMDLSLPTMDGWEATRRMKSRDETRDIPVIALTAHVMSGDRESALEAGCDDFATKPVNVPALIAKIRKLADTRPAE